MVYKRVLSEEERNRYLENLKIKWDTTSNYFWYPLYDTKVKNIISFDISEEGLEKIDLTSIVKQILIENDIEYIVEFIEFGEPEDHFEYEVKDIEIIYKPLERFLFNQSLNWLIYLSHEGFITFGGDILINGIKKYVRDWNKYVVKI